MLGGNRPGQNWLVYRLSKLTAAAARTTCLYKPSSGLIVIWKCMRLSLPSGNTMLVPLVRLSSEMSAGNNAHA